MRLTTTIVRQFRFEAAHRLPNHNGKCRHLHGHSYKVQVAVRGPVSTVRGAPDEGMVMDFSVIKDVFQRRVHAVVDHGVNGTLNDVLDDLPTAENIAAWIFEQMSAEIYESGYAHDANIAWVRVWEQDDAYAEIATP